MWTTNLLTIVAQIFVTLWANLKTVDIQVKTELASIWSIFESFGLFFILISGHTGFANAKKCKYSEKSIALFGEDTREYTSDLKSFGGRYNPNLTHPETKQRKMKFSMSRLNIATTHLSLIK